MHRDKPIHHDAPPIRGYAWHVYPDPATPGVMAGDDPFGAADAPGPARAVITLPACVAQHWKLHAGTPGMANLTTPNSFLVLTWNHEPPPLTEGWFAEAARLDDRFLLDQEGGRWVRLVRIIDSAQSEAGTVAQMEFEVEHP